MIIDIIRVKLSAQRGLLGNVFPELRAVCVESKESLITIYFYIDGEISEDQKECCESALDDITADFFVSNNKEKELIFDTPILRLDYPSPPPLVGHWVYYRHEGNHLI